MPTVGQLVTHTQEGNRNPLRVVGSNLATMENRVEVAWVQGVARTLVFWEYAKTTENGA